MADSMESDSPMLLDVKTSSKRGQTINTKVHNLRAFDDSVDDVIADPQR